MTVMAPPPGWYPSAPGVVAWWDGQRWTGHTAPQAPAYAPVVRVDAGVNHVVHLILTLVTCGLWAPLWLLIVVLDRHPGGFSALSPAGKVGIGILFAGLLLLLAPILHVVL